VKPIKEGSPIQLDRSPEGSLLQGLQKLSAIDTDGLRVEREHCGAVEEWITMEIVAEREERLL
jgi:hypothetical protein